MNAGYGFSDHHDNDCFNGNFAFNGFGTCNGANLNSLVVPSFPTGVAVPAGPVLAPALTNNLGFGNDRHRDGFVGGGQIGYN